MKWFNGLRLRFLIPVLLQLSSLGVIVTISYYYFTRLSSEVSNLTQTEMPKLEAVGQMNSSIQASIRYAWSMYASGLDLEQRKINRELATKAIDDFEKGLTAYKGYKHSDETLKIISQIEPLWMSFKEAHTKTITTLDKNEPRWDEMAKYYMTSSVRSTSTPLSERFSELVLLSMQEQQTVSAASTKETEIAKKMTLGFSLLAVILSSLIMMIVASRTTKRFILLVEDLNGSSYQVQQVSLEVNNTSRELNNGSTTAAASLEETVASLSMIMNLVKQNDQQLQLALDLSKEARDSAETGRNDFSHLANAMKQISESSQKISEITDVIDDIAFQTNLLALNASVEAARAGEHGKGFAVVADAVRTLAQRSATAAKDISSLIHETQERVHRGNKIVHQSEESFHVIVNSVNKVESLSTEIASSSKEQAESINQINQALNLLDQATQNNAHMASILSQASDKMNAETETIASKIIQFKIEVDGNSSRPDNNTNNSNEDIK